MSRGVQHIELIEAKEIDIEMNNDGEMTSIAGTGKTIIFDSCYQMRYETEILKGDNSQDIYDRNIEIELRDDETNSDKILESFYGWAVKFKSGNKTYVVLDPVFGKETETDSNLGHNYVISLTHNVNSNIEDIIYTGS